FFIVDVYIDKNKGRASYDSYIEKVKPIVENYDGEYLVRTERVTTLSRLRKPDRVIVIRFPSREKLDACFASDEYRQIMQGRIDSVDARAYHY
ncbi:MAG: DUF1330 domain-containing protein, partial [bacterium]|nr:DUF1330 domain-containing protein [bacterium]